MTAADEPTDVTTTVPSSRVARAGWRRAASSVDERRRAARRPAEVAPLRDAEQLTAAVEAILFVVDVADHTGALAAALQQPTDAVACGARRAPRRLRRARRRASSCARRRAAYGSTPGRRSRRRSRCSCRTGSAAGSPRRAGDAGRDRLPPAGDPCAGVRDPRGERRRRGAHADHPRAGRRGGHRSGDAAVGCCAPPNCSSRRWAWQSLDELPSLAPLLPDFEGLEGVDSDEL